MKEEIVLGGIKLSELANMKAAMLKDSVKFVADGIEKATLNLNKILAIGNGDSEEFYDMESAKSFISILAEETNELLKNVSLVSDVTGVTYYLPYYEEYGDDIPFSDQLDDLYEFGSSSASALHATLETMESNSKHWHSSTC